MKKQNILVYVFLCWLLTGCTGNESYVFEGKSDRWEAVYEVDIKADNQETTSYKIRYIGKGEIPKEITYEIGSYKGTSVLNDSGVLESSESSCEGCATTDADEKIQTAISWNGKEDNFTLVNE